VDEVDEFGSVPPIKVDSEGIWLDSEDGRWVAAVVDVAVLVFVFIV
jgi:hypothetical protein